MKIQQVHSYISIFWNIHCIREQSWHASSLYMNTVRWWSSPIWINCWTWSAPFSFCAKETISIEKFDCNHGGSWSKLHHITRTLHMTRVEIQLQHENFVALDVWQTYEHIYTSEETSAYFHIKISTKPQLSSWCTCHRWQTSYVWQLKASSHAESKGQRIIFGSLLLSRKEANCNWEI